MKTDTLSALDNFSAAIVALVKIVTLEADKQNPNPESKDYPAMMEACKAVRAIEVTGTLLREQIKTELPSPAMVCDKCNILFGTAVIGQPVTRGVCERCVTT